MPDEQEDRSSIQCAYIELCQHTHNALATRAQHPAHMQWTCPSLRRGFRSQFARVSGIRAVISRYLQIVLFADDWLSARFSIPRGPREMGAPILRWRCPVTSMMGRACIHRHKPDSSIALSGNSHCAKMIYGAQTKHLDFTGHPFQCAYMYNALGARAQQPEYNKWKCPSLPARILLPVCLCFQHLLSDLSLFAARVICRRFGLHKVVNSRGAARI